jgi:transcription elongation factor Elf1
MKAKLKHTDSSVLISCGHCSEEQVVGKNDLTEPVDAFGDFIDIYYKDQEFERLNRRKEKLTLKQQYTELTLVLSLLYDNAIVNADKAMEEYEKNRDPEDLTNVEKWNEVAAAYKAEEIKYKEQLKSGLIVDAPLEDEVYEDQEDNPFDEGEAKVSEKMKRAANIEEILGDTGFLEF